MQQVEHKIRKFIADSLLFGQEDRVIAGSASLLELGIIDSTGVLELVTFIEGTFALKVADAEMIADNLDSVDSLVAFVRRKTDSGT